MIQALEKGVPLCITVTHVDRLVLARSAFHHSINYRSVIIFGHGRWVTDEMKEEALEIISEHLIKRRWQVVRKPNAIELKATGVLEVTIDEASAKIRDKPPVDEEEDYELDIWAGIIPLQHRGEPIPDEQLKPGIEPDPPVSKFLKK